MGNDLVEHSNTTIHKIKYFPQLIFFYRTLAYSVGKTSFYVGNSPKKQVLTITNTFNVTLVIYNATLPLEAKHVFSVSTQNCCTQILTTVSSVRMFIKAEYIFFTVFVCL